MKLKTPLSANQVQSLRGIVDLYYWHGIPCARAWPRPPVQPNSLAQLQARARMRAASAYARTAPATWLARWIAQPSIPGRSYRDQYISCLLRTLAHGQPPPPPDILSAVLSTPGPGPGQVLTLTLAGDVPAHHDDWVCYARAQPPGDPAISSYDSGWHIRRCRAIYKLYRPIWHGFRPHPWSAASTPTTWRADVDPRADALSYCLLPLLPGLDTLTQADALFPPQKVRDESLD